MVAFAALTVALAVPAALLHAVGPTGPARAQVAPAPGVAPDPALPQDGDLTLGGAAGGVLVGLTLRPGVPGLNDLWLYVLPERGEAAAAAVAAELRTQGRSLPVQRCGPTCRHALLDVVGGDRLEVRVIDPSAGSATRSAFFDLPGLPAPGGRSLLDQVDDRMHALQTFRIEEWLGPVDVPGESRVHTALAFQAPDRLRLEVDSGFTRVWVGDTRFVRNTAGEAWRLEEKGARVRVPVLDWDPIPALAAYPVALRIIGSAEVEGVETQIVSFFMQLGPQNPTWYRLWVDGEGLVRQVEMRTQAAHFMDHRYYDFDAPFTIELPAT